MELLLDGAVRLMYGSLIYRHQTCYQKRRRKSGETTCHCVFPVITGGTELVGVRVSQSGLEKLLSRAQCGAGVPACLCVCE